MINLVDKVARILDTFTVERPALTLTECAQAANLNKSSAHRLLTSLEEVGFVERTDLLWRLGPKVISLATVRFGSVDLRRDALVQLRELRRAFRAAVAFSLPEGSDMIYLERLDSPDAFGVSARLGGRAPMWAGGSGKAVLSRMETPEREERLDTEEWHRLPRELRDRVIVEVEQAALRGYCIDHGEFFNGIGGVAVAICDAHRDPVAAISVILPNERLTSEYTRMIADRLLAVAADLESSINPPPTDMRSPQQIDADDHPQARAAETVG